MRIIALWNIWLDRNAAIRKDKGSEQRTKARIWVQMRAYLRSAWDRQRTKICESTITEDKAKEAFLFEYRSHAKVCDFDMETLAIGKMPLEPD